MPKIPRARGAPARLDLEKAGYRVMTPDPRAFWMKFQSVAREDWTGQKLDVTSWEDELSFMMWTLQALQGLTAHPDHHPAGHRGHRDHEHHVDRDPRAHARDRHAARHRHAAGRRALDVPAGVAAAGLLRHAGRRAAGGWRWRPG